MKFAATKYAAFERSYGDAAGVERVKAVVKEYVSKQAGAAGASDGAAGAEPDEE
jgi:hypothetical protein